MGALDRDPGDAGRDYEHDSRFGPFLTPQPHVVMIDVAPPRAVCRREKADELRISDRRLPASRIVDHPHLDGRTSEDAAEENHYRQNLGFF